MPNTEVQRLPARSRPLRPDCGPPSESPRPPPRPASRRRVNARSIRTDIGYVALDEETHDGLPAAPGVEHRDGVSDAERPRPVTSGAPGADVRTGEYGSATHAYDRDEAVLDRKSRPNGVGNGGDSGQESAEAVVVDCDDGDGCMRLFLRHALVGGNEGREAATLRHGQEFVVAERTPVVEDGGFDHDTAELLLEWLA